MKNLLRMGPVAIAGLATALIVISPAVMAAGAEDSEQVSKLLSDAKSQAFQLKEDSQTMESYTRSKLDWQSHASAVTAMKEHINAVGVTLTKLEDARESASAWQAIAIDRIKPLLKEIAANTTTVIAFINKNPRHLFTPESKDYIEANADAADRLSRLVGDFVDYGNTKNRLERLASKLEISGE